jgi:hypothetical protein
MREQCSAAGAWVSMRPRRLFGMVLRSRNCSVR